MSTKKYVLDKADYWGTIPSYLLDRGSLFSTPDPSEEGQTVDEEYEMEDYWHTSHQLNENQKVRQRGDIYIKKRTSIKYLFPGVQVTTEKPFLRQQSTSNPWRISQVHNEKQMFEVKISMTENVENYLFEGELSEISTLKETKEFSSVSKDDVNQIIGPCFSENKLIDDYFTDPLERTEQKMEDSAAVDIFVPESDEAVLAGTLQQELVGVERHVRYGPSMDSKDDVNQTIGPCFFENKLIVDYFADPLERTEQKMEDSAAVDIFVAKSRKGRRYTDDFKRRVSAYLECHSIKEACKFFDITRSSALRWKSLKSNAFTNEDVPKKEKFDGGFDYCKINPSINQAVRTEITRNRKEQALSYLETHTYRETSVKFGIRLSQLQSYRAKRKMVEAISWSILDNLLFLVTSVDQKEASVSDVDQKDASVSYVDQKEASVHNVDQIEASVYNVVKKEASVSDVDHKEASVYNVDQIEASVYNVVKKEDSVSGQKETSVSDDNKQSSVSDFDPKLASASDVGKKRATRGMKRKGNSS